MKRLSLLLSLLTTIGLVCPVNVYCQKTIKYNKHVLYRGEANKKKPAGDGVLYIDASPNYVKDGINTAWYDVVIGSFEDLSVRQGKLILTTGQKAKMPARYDAEFNPFIEEEAYASDNVTFEGSLKVEVFNDSVKYYLHEGKINQVYFENKLIDVPVNQVVITRSLTSDGFKITPKIVHAEFMENVEIKDKQYRYTYDDYNIAFGFVDNPISSYNSFIKQFDLSIDLSNNKAKNGSDKKRSKWIFEDGSEGSYIETVNGHVLSIRKPNGDTLLWSNNTKTMGNSLFSYRKTLGKNNECVVSYKADLPYYGWKQTNNQYRYLAYDLADSLSDNTVNRVLEAADKVREFNMLIQDCYYDPTFFVFQYEDGSMFYGKINKESSNNGLGPVEVLKLNEPPEAKQFACGIFRSSDGNKTIILGGNNWTLERLEQRIAREEEERLTKEAEEKAKQDAEKQRWNTLVKKYGEKYVEDILLYNKITIGMPEGLLKECVTYLDLSYESEYTRTYKIYSNWDKSLLKTVDVDKKTKKVKSVYNHD